MGLSIASLTLASGITLANPYIRINSISGDKDNLQYNMNYYVSREDDKGGKAFVKQSQVFAFTPSADSNSVRWDKQAYEHAKTQTEFINATDVLET